MIYWWDLDFAYRDTFSGLVGTQWRKRGRKKWKDSKKSQIHTDFDCRYANGAVENCFPDCPQRLSLHSILLFDIPETELHPKPGEIRPPCFYVLVDGSQYDCHKCHVLKS